MFYELGTPVHASTRLDRRTFLGASAALGFLGTRISTSAQISTPTSHAEGDADAVAALTSAGQALFDLDTFSFSLETISGSSTIFTGVELESVEGVVRRPIDMRATLTVRAMAQSITIRATAVNGSFYIQDPLSGGSWQNLGEAPELANMINPDWMIQLAISQIKDAQITSDSDETTLVEGYFDLSESLQYLNAESRDTLGSYLAQSPVDVAFWITTSTSLITRAELYGPIFAAESADVEKRIELGAFNEPVDIATPAL